MENLFTSIANPLWGAPRIHGELPKLGIEIGQTSVAKYMARRRGPPSRGWKTFLRNHAAGIVAMDLFVVPTISFRPLYGLLIMGHGRRQILWFGVTAHPTAEWIANQLTEACGWEQNPGLTPRGDLSTQRRQRPIHRAPFTSSTACRASKQQNGLRGAFPWQHDSVRFAWLNIARCRNVQSTERSIPLAEIEQHQSIL
jgi:hypothetical protein